MQPGAIDLLVAGIPDPRTAGLVRSVLARLPDGWDLYRTVGFTVSDEKPARGYANCLRDEESESPPEPDLPDGHQEQCWELTLYRPWLTVFSENAARWIIAHELGHVASGLACGSLILGGRPYTRRAHSGDYREITPEERDTHEKVADAIARAWGFWLEEEAFTRERERILEQPDTTEA